MRLRRIVAAAAACALGAFVAVIPSGSATAAPVQPDTTDVTISWFLWNNGTTNLGAIHVIDGTYAAGPYDGLLAPGERTDVKWGWGQDQGIFLAYPQFPGECASIARKVHGTSTWTFWGMIRSGDAGAGGAFALPYKDSAGRSYDIQAKRYLSTSSLC